MRARLDELFGIDVRALAVLRIGLALLLVVDLVQRSGDLVAHYTDFGLLPRADLLELSPSRWLVSLHLISGVWQIQAILFVVAGVCALALLVGYRTRAATILSWLLFTSLTTRNPLVVVGGDVLFRVVLFWAMFLPLGARYSVDRAWRRAPTCAGPRQRSAATLAYLVQIALVYAVTALRKSDPEWRVDGTALYYALSLDHLATPLAHYLLDLPVLLTPMTHGVLWLEIVGPLLLFSPVLTTPLRTLTVLAFVLLHAGIFLTLRIGLFPWIAALALVPFLPSAFWDRLVAGRELVERTRLTLYHEGACGFCARAVRLITTFGRLPGATIAAADPRMEEEVGARRAWLVVERDGQREVGLGAILTLLRLSPVLWPLGRLLALPWLARSGRWSGRFLAHHSRTAAPLPEVRVPPASGTPGQRLAGAAAIVLLGYVILWNVTALPRPPFRLAERWRSVGYVLRLDQTWSMFAPSPSKEGGWYVIPGRLRNGEIVDLLRDGGELRWDRPATLASIFPNTRWRRYMMLLRDHREYAPGYARYLCRSWNRTHAGGSPGRMLEDVEIVFVVEPTLPDRRRGEPRRVVLLRRGCAELERPRAGTAVRQARDAGVGLEAVGPRSGARHRAC
jgi:hypothetical protein